MKGEREMEKKMRTEEVLSFQQREAFLGVVCSFPGFTERGRGGGRKGIGNTTHI